MSKLFGMFNEEDDKKDTSEDNKKTTSEENKKETSMENKQDSVKEGKLRLHKEELSINKNKVHTGDVELSKEIVEEKKTMDVPVTREEVVIERKIINNESSDSPIGSTETIRIPVSEEKVEVEKRTVVTGEVSAYKRQIENTEHIEETLKSEEARVTKVGNPSIVSKEKSNSND